MKISTALKALLGAAVITLPIMAHAESTVTSGTGTLTATAHVNFAVVIPRVLYLRVGTGSTYASATPQVTSVGTIDTVSFTPAAGNVGNGTAVTGTGGDLSNGVETAAILANSGSVTLTATATGALSDGAGDTIPYTQITTTAATLTSTTALPAPVLSNTTSNSVVLTAPASKLVIQDAKWTFGYLNTVAAPAGTYGATVANNGQVTYTATMP